MSDPTLPGDGAATGTATPSAPRVATRSGAATVPFPPSPASPPRRSWRGTIAAVVVVGLVAAAVAVAVVDPFKSSTPSGFVGNSYPTSLATVKSQAVTSQTQVGATLGYSGSYTVVNQTQGTYTELPAVGTVVSQGQVFYEVDGGPVVLLYGSTPAYRAMAESTTSTPLAGADVEELNADLVALGDVSSADLSPTDDQFTSWTKVGVQALQKTLGVTQDGTLPLGSVVFLPGAVRLTKVTPTLGSPAQPGSADFTASSTSRVVTIDLDADQQSEVKAGDQVSITLPSGESTPGVVWSVGSVATESSDSGPGGSSSPTITVLVVPTDPAATGTIDQAPVEVTVTTARVPRALVVPVNALLALATGGYAVEEVGPHRTHHLLPVQLGLFDDAEGVVQVSGPGLAAGQQVVVPGS